MTDTRPTAAPSGTTPGTTPGTPRTVEAVREPAPPSGPRCAVCGKGVHEARFLQRVTEVREGTGARTYRCPDHIRQ